MTLSQAGIFTLSCLVPSGLFREFFAKSPGRRRKEGEIYSLQGMFLLLTLGTDHSRGSRGVPRAHVLCLWPPCEQD